MCISAAAYIAYLLLDRRTQVIYLEDENPNYTELLSNYELTTQQPNIVLIKLTDSCIDYIGVAGLDSDTRYVITRADLPTEKIQENIQVNLSGECHKLQTYIEQALITNIVEFIELDRSPKTLTSTEVFGELLSSGCSDILFINHYQDNYYPCIETDLGYVSLVGGNFILFS